jgi:3-hydroxyacyl-[acyl-carrier-protein] dehydratase
LQIKINNFALNMSFNNILEYIPQRPPFVMIDHLVEVNEKNTITSLEITSENLFTEEGVFYEGGIIENIAQTVAAGAGYRLKQSGGNPKMGVIASIRKLSINERPAVGQVLKTEVELISDFGNAIVVKGTVTNNNKEIASCQMNVFIIDTPESFKI